MNKKKCKAKTLNDGFVEGNKRDRRFGEDLKCATDFWWFFIDLVQSGCSGAVCCQSSQSGTERRVRALSHDFRKKTSCKIQQHLAVPEKASSGNSSMKAAVSKQ